MCEAVGWFTKKRSNKSRAEWQMYAPKFEPLWDVIH